MTKGVFRVLSTLFICLLLAIVLGVGVSIVTDIAPDTYILSFIHKDYVLESVELKVGEYITQDEMSNIEKEIKVSSTQYLVWSTDKTEVKEADVYSLQEDTILYAHVLNKEYKVNVNGNIDFEYELIHDGKIISGSVVEVKLKNLGNFIPLVKANGKVLTANDNGNYEIKIVNKDVDVYVTLTEKLTLIPLLDESYTYTGEKIEVSYLLYDSDNNLINDVEVKYYKNDLTEISEIVNAGSYYVSFIYTGDEYIVDEVTLPLTVNKATADMSKVSFNDATYTYDGSEKVLEITGELPQGVEVSYTNNKLTNAGELNVTANFIVDTLNYNPVESMSATLKINKATFDMSGVSFNDAAYTYDGREKILELTGCLPQGLTVSYSNNKLTNAGTLEVIATFTCSDNYNPVESMSATLTINKATYDMSNVSFSDATYIYDGREKTLELTGTLPDGLSVSYSPNKLTNVGVLEVTATFTGDATNYYLVDSMKATLTINKATYDMSNISFNDATYIYDGKEKTLEITGTLPNGLTVTYSPNKLTNVGEVEVIATFTGDATNYYLVDSMKATLKVNKATYDMSGVSFNDATYTYDGSAKTLEITGDLPEGLTVTYSPNTLTDSGKVEVVATFIGDDTNYYLVDSMKATLTINKAILTATGRNYQVFIGEGISQLDFEVKITGFVGGEDETVLTGSWVYTCEVIEASPAGNYPVTFTGVSAKNYTINYVYGNVEVIKDAIISINQADLTKVYNGQSQTFTAKLRDKNGIIEGIEFIYTWNNQTFTGATNVGHYNVLVSYDDPTYGKGSIEVVFDITKATYDLSEISFDDATYIYDGTKKVLEISGNLPNGLTVSYTTNHLTKVGEIEVVATFNGDSQNYYPVESMKATLKITPKALESAMFDELGNYYYTGSEIKPNIIGSYNQIDLVLGTDFNASYSNNTNVGVASVTVSGINNFSGEVTLTFTISLSDLEKASRDLSEILNKYDGSLVDKVYTDCTYNSVINYISTSTAIVIDANGNVTSVLIDKEQLITVYVSATLNDAVVYDEIVFTLPVKPVEATFIKKTITDALSTGVTNDGLEVSGVVTSIVNSTYGNIYLTDPETKDQIYVYGLVSSSSSAMSWVANGEKFVGTFSGSDQSFGDTNIAVGDYITVRCIISEYKGIVQLNAQYLSTNEAPNNKYEVSTEIDSSKGTITGLQNSYNLNEEVTFTVTPKAGYIVKVVGLNQGYNLSNYDSNDIALDGVNGVYKFKASIINNIKVEFMEESSRVDYIDFSSKGYSNGQEVTSEVVGLTTITFNKGSNSNSSKYYTSGTAVRAYGGNTITFTSTGNISKIVIIFGSSNGSNAITSSVGTVSSDRTTIEIPNGSQTVVLTIDGTSGHVRFKTVSIEYVAGSGEEPSLTDQEKVNQDKEALNIETNITDSISLPSAGEYSSITWTSSNEDVIKITADKVTVTRLSEDVTVTLTATLKLNDVEVEKTFDVVVAKKEVVTPPTTSLFNDGDKVIIATVRSSGNYFILSNDLGTGSTKRYQAVDTGLTDSSLLASSNDNQIWTIRFDGTNYYLEDKDGKKMDWTSGNSGALTATGSPLTITKNNDGTYLVQLVKDSSRYLSLNGTSGNNYFAFYGGTQKQNLVIKVISNQDVLSDEEKASVDKEALSIETNIKDSINLPNAGDYSTITWESKDPSIIKIENGVASVTQYYEVKTVTLIATIKVNNASVTKEFIVTVQALLTDEDKVNLDIENVELPDLVSTSLTLPTKGTYSSISWESGNSEIIKINGNEITIVRPGIDTVVTLIGTFTLNEASIICEFEVVVAGETIDTYLEITTETEIVDGMQLIIADPSGSNAMASQETKYRNITPLDINNVSSEVCVVTLVEVTAGVYYLQTSEGNLYISKDDNVLNTGNIDTDAAKWTFTIDTNGDFLIQNVGYNARYLQYNGSSARFACYKSSSNQKNVKLYSKNAVEKTPEDIVEFDIKALSLSPNVNSGYILPVTGKYGSTIKWVIGTGFETYYSDGKLVNDTNDNVEVTLYAYFKYGTYESTKQEYTVRIISSNISSITPDPGNYYDSISNVTGQALLLELRTLITSTHTYITDYDDLKTYLPDADQDLENPDNMILFYTGESIKKKYDCTTWNREHVWCQSHAEGWFGTSGAGADMHHIRPCNSSVNSSRSNTPFGESAGYYEPTDEYKGDVARIIFYLLTRYETADNYSVNVIAESMDMLLEWNELDPVSNHEAYRNDYISDIQGNRNPFIDNSDYAEAIWG